MSVVKLAFPLVSYDRHLKFESLLITNEVSSTTRSSSKRSSLKIERLSSHDEDHFKACLNELSVTQPLSYIENILHDSESDSPLLIKVPAHFDTLRLSLSVEFSENELEHLKSNMFEKELIFDELLLVKVTKDDDLSLRIEAMKNGIKTDSVRSIGTVSILPSGAIPTTQSLVSGTSSHDYAFPSIETPVRISVSLPLKTSDSGKMIFYMFNKSQGRLEKLLSFAFWKDLNSPQVTKDTIDHEASSSRKTISFENDLIELPLSDGPEFRQLVSNYEEKIPLLKQQVSTAILNGKSLEASLNAAAEAKHVFINSLKTFDSSNRILKDLIETIVDPLLKRSANNDENLLNNLKMNVLIPLNSIFANNNINALNSNKKIFEDESQRFYAWLNKYLSSGKSKDEKFLGKRKSFELAKFDYLTYLINIANNTSSSFELISHLTVFINNIDKNLSLVLPKSPKEIQKATDKLENDRKLMRKRIGSAKTDEELDNVLSTFSPHLGDGRNLYKAGLLYTYGGQGKQGWHKHWVVLNNSSLVEYSDWRKGKDKKGSLIDISLCSIKPVSQEKRKNCFEIITSKGVKNMYQATSETERDSWIKVLYDAGQIIRFGDDKKGKDEDVHRRRFSSVSLKNLQLVQSLDKSNLTCCDCECAEGVEWISLNLLIIVCVQCSSSHRNLGTSISKIRSLKLDNFSNEQLSLISQINNSKSNHYFESELTIQKTTPHSSNQERLDFIGSKYRDKLFLKKQPPNTSVNNILLYGLKDRNFNEMLWAIALGANINMSLEKHGEDFSLFEYSLTKPFKRSGTELYDIAEFLILNSLSLPADVHSSLPLSDSALKYWSNKIEKIYGSTTIRQRLQENAGIPHSENDKRGLKINTSIDNSDVAVGSEKKITSPSSATARYSRNLIKKITTNNAITSTYNNGHHNN